MADECITTSEGTRIVPTYTTARYSPRDFVALHIFGGGVNLGVQPLYADECERLADVFANLAMRLRGADQDRDKFLAALAADEREAA